MLGDVASRVLIQLSQLTDSLAGCQSPGWRSSTLRIFESVDPIVVLFLVVAWKQFCFHISCFEDDLLLFLFGSFWFLICIPISRSSAPTWVFNLLPVLVIVGIFHQCVYILWFWGFLLNFNYFISSVFWFLFFHFSPLWVIPDVSDLRYPGLVFYFPDLLCSPCSYLCLSGELFSILKC